MDDESAATPLADGLDPGGSGDKGDRRPLYEIAVHKQQPSRHPVALLAEGARMTVEGEGYPADSTPGESDKAEDHGRVRGDNRARVHPHEIAHRLETGDRVADKGVWPASFDRREEHQGLPAEQFGDLHASSRDGPPGDEHDGDPRSQATSQCSRSPPSGRHGGLVYHLQPMTPEGDASSRSELPTVSVVIPTYRHAGRLEKCVRALLADPATTEVVVAIDRVR